MTKGDFVKVILWEYREALMGLRLVFLICFAFSLDAVDADFLVVLLQCSHVFASLGELAFLHTFTDIPKIGEIEDEKIDI